MSKRSRDMAFRNFNKGVSLIEKGLHEEALDMLEEAENQAKQAEAPQILAAVLQTYADLLFAYERNEDALERYLAASEILEDKPEYLPDEQSANMYSNMALALEKAERKEEAKQKYAVSASAYRDLIEKQPDDVSHISNAVATLNNMGALLAEMGLDREALDVLEEAFDLHEKTSESGDEDLFKQKKATILENLLNIPLENVSGLDEEKYTRLLEQYAGINADNTGLLKMAKALQNIAHIRKKEGNTEEAFEKLEEALKIASGLFDEKPDDPVSRKMLIDILRDMNKLLENEEQSERLLEMYGVILEMSRKLLNSMPENTSYQLNVAFSLNITGNLLKDLGRLDEATRNMEESVELAIKVLENEKDDNSSLQVVVPMIEDMLSLIEATVSSNTKLILYTELDEKIKAFSQENLEIGLISAAISYNTGRILANCGKYGESLAHFKKALGTYEAVKHATGDSSKMNDVLESIADAQSEMGIPDDALNSYMQLIRSGNSNAKYPGMIDSILREKERIADNTGDLEFLKKEYEKIITIRTELLGLIPDEDGKNGRSIKILQEKIADLMIATGQTEEALQVYEQLHEAGHEDTYLTKITQLLEKMATSVAGKRTPEKMKAMEFLLAKYNNLIKNGVNNPSITSKRASIIENMAGMQAENGDIESAAKMYESALDAYVGLSGINPDNILPVEKIAEIQARLADIASENGKEDEAKLRYENSLEFYDRLIEIEPSNRVYQLNYGNVLDGIGALYVGLGMHQEAKKSYENSLKAFGAVMESEPENKAYRTNVTITLENLGYVLELMGRKEDALWMYENARKIENEST